MAGKSCFELESNQYGRGVNPGIFNTTIILLGLAGHKMIITNWVLRASLKNVHIRNAFEF